MFLFFKYSYVTSIYLMDNYFFNSLQYKLLQQQEHVVGLPDKNE